MNERAAAGGAPRAPEGRPGQFHSRGVRHHAIRLALLLASAFAIHLLFPVTPVPDFPELEEGMVAQQDVIAEVGFPIYKTEAELDREREEAAAAVAPIFDFEPAAADTMQARINGFFARLERVANERPASARAGIAEVLRSYQLQAAPEIVEALLSVRNREMLRAALRQTVAVDLPRGVAASGDLQGNPAQLQIRRGGAARILARDSVPTVTGFVSTATERFSATAPPAVSELNRLILIRTFEPSLRLNANATEAARDRARRAVAPIKADVVAGEKIIGANERIRAEQLERLNAYREHLARIGALGESGWSGTRTLGAWLMNAFLLLIYGLVTYFYRPSVYGNLRHVVLILGMALVLLAAAALIDRFDAPPQLVPIAFPVMVVAALWDARMALNFALLLSILLSAQTPFGGVSLLFTFVLGGASAAFAVRAVRRRAETWRYVIVIALAYFAATVTLALLRTWDVREIAWAATWGLVNAVVSSVFAMGFLPLFESFARITTDQTLLELADLNRPLLQRLSREAPGTFAHTINVANLAEAAARAIGANALLARVGVYYHDIGKVDKPQYFIENQPQGRNPHDHLKPGTSASIVRHHVTEGLRLADAYRLPKPVKDFIEQHHGTQPIGFFLEQAREQDPDGAIDPHEYAYPGPRPQTQETAIAMLADSVESAARVLQDPTPERIADLVDRIVQIKIDAGQLDETPLTLNDLRRCKEAFSTVLAGMYHHRIDYPQLKEPSHEAPALPDVTGGVAGTTAGPGVSR